MFENIWKLILILAKCVKIIFISNVIKVFKSKETKNEIIKFLSFNILRLLSSTLYSLCFSQCVLLSSDIIWQTQEPT